MEIELKKLNADEFPEFITASIEDYAQGMSANQGLDITSAREKAKRDARNIEMSDNSYLTGIIDIAIKEVVGGISFRINEEKKSVFIYHLLIFGQYRQRGYAKAALKKLESELKEKGIKRFEFNVFADNEVALRLYEKSGYHITNFYMAKDL